jgi:hypothetical protein
MGLTAAVVRYACTGLRARPTAHRAQHRFVFAKISPARGRASLPEPPPPRC